MQRKSSTPRHRKDTKTQFRKQRVQIGMKPRGLGSRKETFDCISCIFLLLPFSNHLTRGSPKPPITLDEQLGIVRAKKRRAFVVDANYQLLYFCFAPVLQTSPTGGGTRVAFLMAIPTNKAPNPNRKQLCEPRRQTADRRQLLLTSQTCIEERFTMRTT